MNFHSIVLTLVSLFVCLCANATEKAFLNVRTIEVLPYGIKSEHSQSGVYFDLMNTVLEESGYEFENLVYPYARIIHELKSGQADLTIMFRYDELHPYVEYIHPLPTLQLVVIGQKGRTIVTSTTCIQKLSPICEGRHSVALSMPSHASSNRLWLTFIRE